MNSLASPISPVLSYTLEDPVVDLPVGKEGKVEEVKKVEEFIEPILKEDISRYVLFPIKYPAIFQHYKNHVAVFWTPEEIDLTKDQKDFVKMTPNEQHYVKSVLGYFSASDSLLMENLAARFMNDVQIAEARQFYSFQIAMEAIHSETYSLLIDTYIQDEQEKQFLLNAIHNVPSIKAKADWTRKWIDSKDESFAARLIAFICIEGLLFSSSFTCIYWIRQRGLLPGLTTANDFIARDEGIHCDAGITIYGELQRRLPKAKVHKIIKEAVELESVFTTESLPCSLIGMNSELMIQYVKFVADRISTQLGYGKIYGVTCPFDFMDTISMEKKTNFFEARNSIYTKAGVGKTREEMSFSLNEEF